MTTTATRQPTTTNTGAGAQDGTDGESRNHAQCPTGRDEFTEWLIASCQRQDLPVTVTDHTVLAAVATLLR
ncbi:hypothetical protein [Mycolicibacter sinensis]|uniref:hypothetical protein n=1 Tax=Mycolicibacter sinensis (strain JDM601) TaxID=875328 RepID=UPI0007E9F677|nr:hypothetical protein [Mycolicibacter sinensis]OBH16612.1 hypothetical protein A5694_05975 [Mycolicibacter sinensis]